MQNDDPVRMSRILVEALTDMIAESDKELTQAGIIREFTSRFEAARIKLQEADKNKVKEVSEQATLLEEEAQRRADQYIKQENSKYVKLDTKIGIVADFKLGKAE